MQYALSYLEENRVIASHLNINTESLKDIIDREGTVRIRYGDE